LPAVFCQYGLPVSVELDGTDATEPPLPPPPQAYSSNAIRRIILFIAHKTKRPAEASQEIKKPR
jgi:hypothetical protein